MPKVQNIMRVCLEEKRKGNVYVDGQGFFRSADYLEKVRNECYFSDMRSGKIPLGYSYEEYLKTYPLDMKGYVEVDDICSMLEKTFAFKYVQKGNVNAKSKTDS